ncbi:hypothetical protein ACRAWD_29850 [Caulobacter segnis]
MFAAGLFDKPVAPGGAIDYDAGAEVARAAATEGVVLLKNRQGLAAPGQERQDHRGDLAATPTPASRSGGGSSPGRPAGRSRDRHPAGRQKA